MKYRSFKKSLGRRRGQNSRFKSKGLYSKYPTIKRGYKQYSNYKKKSYKNGKRLGYNKRRQRTGLATQILQSDNVYKKKLSQMSKKFYDLGGGIPYIPIFNFSAHHFHDFDYSAYKLSVNYALYDQYIAKAAETSLLYKGDGETIPRAMTGIVKRKSMTLDISGHEKTSKSIVVSFNSPFMFGTPDQFSIFDTFLLTNMFFKLSVFVSDNIIFSPCNLLISAHNSANEPRKQWIILGGSPINDPVLRTLLRTTYKQLILSDPNVLLAILLGFPCANNLCVNSRMNDDGVWEFTSFDYFTHILTPAEIGIFAAMHREARDLVPDDILAFLKLQVDRSRSFPPEVKSVMKEGLDYALADANHLDPVSGVVNDGDADHSLILWTAQTRHVTTRNAYQPTLISAANILTTTTSKTTVSNSMNVMDNMNRLEMDSVTNDNIHDVSFSVAQLDGSYDRVSNETMEYIKYIKSRFVLMWEEEDYKVLSSVFRFCDKKSIAHFVNLNALAAKYYLENTELPEKIKRTVTPGMLAEYFSFYDAHKNSYGLVKNLFDDLRMENENSSISFRVVSNGSYVYKPQKQTNFLMVCSYIPKSVYLNEKLTFDYTNIIKMYKRAKQAGSLQELFNNQAIEFIEKKLLYVNT